MRFRELELGGVWLVEPEPIGDQRGAFWRTFCEREMSIHGLETRFVQHSQSHSARAGTLRGMHFQAAPHAEVKLVSCVRGAIRDVVVDLRPASATFRRWIASSSRPQNRRQIYIPKGFAHGFITLDDDSVVSYLISEFYTPGGRERPALRRPRARHRLARDAHRDLPDAIRAGSWLEASLA
jgi:dTDP-4-dehydrorhamnose 3,5-epimerase